MAKVGRIQPYDTGYRVMYGTRGTDTFFEEIFPYSKYGGARKAKREALKLWNSDDFQNKMKEVWLGSLSKLSKFSEASKSNKVSRPYE